MVLAVALTLPVTSRARAADPIFPIGSRLGIVPPLGMVQSHNFVGFEDPEKNAAILFTTLPAQAYDSLDKTMVPDVMKKDGIGVEKREPIQLSFGKGFILSGTQATDKERYRKWLVVAAAGNVTALITAQVPDQDTAYPEKAMREALATLVMRDSVPDAEQLSLMPFTIGDMAGFRIDEVLPGRAIMLVDKPADAAPAQAKDQSQNQSKDAKDQSKDAPILNLNARLFIAAMPGGPAEPGDRSNFARNTFQQVVGIKDVHIQDAEPLRIGSQQGFETLAKAKDAQSDTDVMVVQWLRFGTAGFLQMIGIARADTWPTMFTRLRAVRDSIDPK
ncbi:MAG: hypothetical protein WBD83_14035 [Xanthobacteraceae bacterium]